MLAALASLGTDPAMFMHVRVVLAFIAACLAYRGASVEHCAGDVGVVTGMAGEDVSRRGADVRAVQICADAFGQLGHHVLA